MFDKALSSALVKNYWKNKRSLCNVMSFAKLIRDRAVAISFGIEFGESTVYFSPSNTLAEVDNGSCSHLLPAKKFWILSAFEGGSFAKDVDKNTKLRENLKEYLLEIYENKTEIPSLCSAFTYHHFKDQQSGFNYMEATALYFPESSDKEDFPEKLLGCFDKLGIESYFKLESKLPSLRLKGYSPAQEKTFACNVFLHQKPDCHPAFFKRNTNSVCHNYQTAVEILSQFEHLEEVRELLAICGKYVESQSELPHKAKHPVVVLEGLDACGKTTLCGKVSESHLASAVLKSPPPCIEHLRTSFDRHPPPLRRAFYSLGNYIFSAMISERSRDGLVVCDRFWHSTAAYAIATDVKNGDVDNLPPVGHWTWKWPEDLTKPDVCVFLHITDDTRIERMRRRGQVRTDEELRIEKSRLFRERLKECYRRMEQPGVEVLDASASPQHVFRSFRDLLVDKKLVADQ